MSPGDVPFDLVDTKLAVPSTRPGAVAKTAVIARLRTSRAPFAAVVAPAGYGKTTLLTHWAATDPRPFAWVTLDERDVDAVMFLRYIAAAIHGVEPVAPAVFDALAGRAASIWSTRVPSLGAALAALERPLVLVLDDLHAVGNPACVDVIVALLGYVPSGSQIAVASRERPPLPLARWRTQGRLHEVGVADLRLDAHEAELLLTGAGVALDSAEFARLTDRTEGWPAGLYLAALSLGAGGPGPASADAFTGDDRFVSEYFRLELLSQLPEAEARFLTHSSVLHRMCGGLCDAVLETTHSAYTLESLERSNCFVVPLDRRGRWYRYHHLFGQLLRNELDRSEPEAAAELNRRAMAWCVANDQAVEAVSYGRAAGELDAVAGLVDGLALPLYYDGRMETVEEWLGWFGDDDLMRFPAIAVYGAWNRALNGSSAEAERWLSLAQRSTSTMPLSDGSATIEPWVANLRAYMMPDGVQRALADAHLALEQLAPDSFFRPSALLIRGVAHALLGATESARTDLVAAVETANAIGAVDDAFVAHAELALLAAQQGAWSEAGRHAQQAQALVEETGLDEYAGSAIAHVAVARVALHEGRQVDARAALMRAHRLRPLLEDGFHWAFVQVGLELTRAHLALGEAAAARSVFTETETALEHRRDVGSLVEDAAELHGRVAAASGPDGAWAMSLTGAELRLLPYLATHLTFREIANRLYVERTTVGTHVVSIYRKLGASSRNEAIERAVKVGLLDGFVYPQQASLAEQR